MPSPVAISVTKVRSDGMSAVRVATQRVVAQPLLVVSPEQLDKVEHRPPRTLENLERCIPCASTCRGVGRQENEWEIAAALVQHGRLAERLPEGVRPSKTGAT